MLTGPFSSCKALCSADCSSFSQVLDPSSVPAIEHETVNTWSQATTLGTENK